MIPPRRPLALALLIAVAAGVSGALIRVPEPSPLAAMPLLAAAAEATESIPTEPEIRDLFVAASGGQVLVTLRLAGAMTGDLRERIESGLPTSLAYELELLRDRKRWWDRGLESSYVEIVAMYNAVTREYLVNTKHDGKLIGSRTVRDLDELEASMTVLDAFPAFVAAPESQRTRYLVRVRVGLGSGSFFGFPYQRSTSWVESNKVRFTPAAP